MVVFAVDFIGKLGLDQSSLASTCSELDSVSQGVHSCPILQPKDNILITKQKSENIN